MLKPGMAEAHAPVSLRIFMIEDNSGDVSLRLLARYGGKSEIDLDKNSEGGPGAAVNAGRRVRPDPARSQSSDYDRD